MTHTKLLLVGLVTAGLSFVSVSSTVFATPLTQIEEGEKCNQVNQIVEEGIWSYKCTKTRKKKLWQFNGMSSTTTTSTTTTSTTTTSTTTTTTIPSAPAAPTGLTYIVNSPFDGKGTISWTDNSNNEESFYVSNIDPAKLVSTPLTSVWFKGSANSKSVSFSGIKQYSRDCYWVMASNSLGNSAWTGPSCTWAGMSNRTTQVANLQEFVNTHGKSVVTVYCGNGSGSGVSISTGSTNWKTELGAQSIIATNMHVVIDCIKSGTNWRENQVTILHQGVEYRAYVHTWPSFADYRSGAKPDLALVMTTGLIPAKDYWSVRAPQLGDAVVAIGSTYGIPNITTRGEIAGVTSKDLFTTAPAGHGSSGGALFNNDGQLLGFIYRGNGSIVMVVPMPRLCEAVLNCGSAPIEYLP